MSWEVYIGQSGANPQPRVSNIQVTEEFGMVNFSVTISDPTTAERNQFKGRKDAAIIQIKRGTDVIAEGFIEDVEYGGGYVTYTGRSFLVLLGYSTASTTTSGGDGTTEAEFEDKTGKYIIDNLITTYCTIRDSEITKNITFSDTYYGKVKLHGKKVYQITKEMCQMYGYDLWSETTWAGNNITQKIIKVGMRERGDSTTPHTTLYGGRHLRGIPVVRNRSSQTMNCLRVIGGGTGKDKVSEWVEDETPAPDNSIDIYGYIEGEPYHNNMIRSVATAQSVGQAIITAKKDPIEQIKVDLIIYMSNLEYGDWIRIVDNYTELDTIRRIKKIVRIYTHDGIDQMQLELGNAFDNYQNIIQNLTKGDVDPEPEMVMAGGSLRITANDPPSDYVRIDGGNWYGTDGILHNYGNTIRVFWGGEPPYNATTVDNYFKALVQIKDGASSSSDITYKTSLTSGAHTGYTKIYAKAEVITPDIGYTPIGELILRCSSAAGGISNVTALDEGGSFIYRDARPIVGSSSSGYGGEGRWALTSDETWTASTVYAVGDWVSPTTPTNYTYICKSITGGGTSGATEPSPWGVIIDGDTTDHEVTWTCHYNGIIVDSVDGVTDLDVWVKPQGSGVVYLG